MTTLNVDLLDALRAAGVDEETARRTTCSVPSAEDREQLVTKDFLRASSKLGLDRLRRIFAGRNGSLRAG